MGRAASQPGWRIAARWDGYEAQISAWTPRGAARRQDTLGGLPSSRRPSRPSIFCSVAYQRRGRALPAKTVRQRQAERRRQKLESMKEQIEAGTLTIRQMTPAERQRHPPPERPRPRRSWM
jgi:hypothetical protein